jgi:hypothetical protein
MEVVVAVEGSMKTIGAEEVGGRARHYSFFVCGHDFKIQSILQNIVDIGWVPNFVNQAVPAKFGRPKIENSVDRK